MTEFILRGRLLDFTRKPEGPEDTTAHRYVEDGALLIRDGKIVARGDYANIAQEGVEVVDHRPHLILPGFIDTHLHFPQVQVIGSWGAQLLDWLNTYTFPAELAFADADHAREMATAFFDLLTAHGTTTPVAFCSVHPVSAEAYFTEAARRDMAVIGGKVMMDRNAPDGLTDTPERGYDETKALIEKWHGKGRAEVAITPRFAITSTPAQLKAAGALAQEFPDCPIQTHLSENHDEIAFTAELYPEARDYFDIYQRYGLAGPKSLFGHAIHLTDRERSAIAETDSVAVFCPTSNLFLGSGLFDRDGLEGAGVRTAIATDIGGGTSYSMLRTMDEGYKVLQLNGQKLHPFESYYWSTRGNAEALGKLSEIGTLEVGSAADVVVLDAAATPAMALRMAAAETLAEELFILQTLGDDRAVAQTYVAGTAQKNVSVG
ncbi:guanine deaminase [Paracoccaceae bacterium GXU_MW_L88]